MRASTEATLLRIFIGEEDRCGGQPLCGAIVAKAIETQMAGATVILGTDGFGCSRHGRTELYPDAGPRLPLVIEIVDSKAQIDRFLQILHDMTEDCVVTLEKVRAIRYFRSNNTGPKARGQSPPA